MRWQFAAVVCASCFAVPAAEAASLSGSPIYIDAVSGGTVGGDAFETLAGEVGVVFAERFPGQDTIGAIYLQVFNKKGPKRGRALVFQSYANGERCFDAFPAGTIALNDGNALVGYVSRRGTSTGSTTGLYGRMVYGGDRVGGEYDLRDGAPDSTGGLLLPLADKGLALATRSNTGRSQGYGAIRFVSKAGKIGFPVAEITRRGAQIFAATKYRDGFIVTYANPGDQRLLYVKARIYDENGKSASREVTLESEPSFASFQTRVLGLSDGSIVVTRLVPRGDGQSDLSAEVFDGSWSTTVERTVLATIPSGRGYVTEALPAGGFVLGRASGENSSTGYVLRQYDASLAAVGSALQVPISGGANLIDILARKSGDLFITYTSSGSGVFTFYGQYVDP